MKATKLSIPDVVLFEPKVFEDSRGYFFESFNEKLFKEATGADFLFVQDNHSKSQKNVLRGLHYQESPMAQGKLVRVVQGEVFDVAVDIRPNSKTYGKWVSEILSAENKKQLWISPGFAHGFLVLSQTAEFVYKTTNYYSPAHEKCILWNDPSIGIVWPLNNENPIVSLKDAKGVLIEIKK